MQISKMNLQTLFFIIFSTFSFTTFAQYEPTYEVYENIYNEVKDSNVKNRRFKHKDVLEKLENLPNTFKQKQVGVSVEGRSIHLVSWGNGPVSVFLWSQMHGDEPTATAAIFDIFNALQNPKLKDEIDSFKDKITLHFIPMLNPDGADAFRRRNSMGIDLNRDALRLQAPESKILKHVRDSLSADWGFNLHDQNRYYSAGLNNPYTAALSFLAPPFNYEKDINEKRGDAMRLIGLMNKVLQRYVPNGIGKYSDDFEPRAFGDNIQKWGTRTILIESGAEIGDREKQNIRRLNFISLMAAFHAIADKGYEWVQLNEYHRIPFNESNGFHELIIRKGKVTHHDQSFVQDIAFRFNEKDDTQHANFTLDAYIKDLGDMSIYAAYEEINATGMEVVTGKVSVEEFSYQEVKQKGEDFFLRKGISDVVLNAPQLTKDILPFKYVKVHPKGSEIKNNVWLGQNPTLFIQKNNKNVYFVRNGQVLKF